MDKLSWHFCKLATCFSNVSSSHIDLQDDGNESRASDLETQHVCDVDVSMHKQHDKNNGMQGADDIYLHHVAIHRKTCLHTEVTVPGFMSMGSVTSPLRTSGPLVSSMMATLFLFSLLYSFTKSTTAL